MSSARSFVLIADLPRPETLPRARIIRRRSVFDRVRHKGRRLNNRWLTLSVLPLDPDGTERATVAFLTPKRIGSAAVRNKLRRRMREIYRREPGAVERQSYLVWIARPPAVELEFGKLRERMSELLLRVR